MHEEVLNKLEAYVEAGWKLDSSKDYEVWLRKFLPFLSAVADQEVVSSIERLGGESIILEWRTYRDRQVSRLEGILLNLRHMQRTVSPASVTSATAEQVPISADNKVFVVHGHDIAAKESVARFLEKLQLSPVILHEQPNANQTVIEKFESHANVSFAVVLLTPDDVGASAATPTDLRGRARQNVILELGYFTGRLGRRRVCALYRPGVEVPSDFHGVLFIELDAQGGWKTQLAQELVTAGLKIELAGLLR